VNAKISSAFKRNTVLQYAKFARQDLVIQASLAFYCNLFKAHKKIQKQQKEKRKRRISNRRGCNVLSLILISKINSFLGKLGTIYSCTIQLTVEIYGCKYGPRYSSPWPSSCRAFWRQAVTLQ